MLESSVTAEEVHSWLGKRGATSQRWEYDFICIAWRKLAKKFPKLNAVQRSRKLEALAAEDDELSRACFEYIAKNFEPLLRKLEARENPKPQPEAREREIEAIQDDIRQQVVLLNLEMPNGKQMRYCTGTQMLGFGKHYQAIGKKCGSKMVGSVLNEDEVRRLAK